MLLGLLGAANDLHPAAATAALGLDGDWVAVLLAELVDLVDRLHGVGGAGDDGDVGVPHRLPGLRLLAELLHRLRGGADPRHTLRVLDLARELSVLREEAVAWVDGVGAGLFGGVDDGLVVEVGVGGAGGADVVRLVGVANVARVFVGVAVDGDGVDAEFLAGPHHADRDFAAVGDEYLLEHSWSWILETAY